MGQIKKTRAKIDTITKSKKKKDLTLKQSQNLDELKQRLKDYSIEYNNLKAIYQASKDKLESFKMDRDMVNIYIKHFNQKNTSTEKCLNSCFYYKGESNSENNENNENESSENSNGNNLSNGSVNGNSSHSN